MKGSIFYRHDSTKRCHIPMSDHNCVKIGASGTLSFKCTDTSSKLMWNAASNKLQEKASSVLHLESKQEISSSVLRDERNEGQRRDIVAER
jgi:hypothetical protein